MIDRVTQTVANVLAGHGLRGRRIALGLSGGMDSVALLDVLDRLRAAFALSVSAVHVNHGISVHADEWARFCESLCVARGIALRVTRVEVPRDGSGVEAAARRRRYEAYALVEADVVALAHHLDDQVETFLLQLLRGAGARGLAAMPMLRMASGGWRGPESSAGHAPASASLMLRPGILRPFLDVPRCDLLAYANARGLHWVEDDSNADSGYDRNFLRNELLPLVAARFPGYRETFARSSRNLADYAALADELAEIDWQPADRDTVNVERLRQLSDARALNLLRRLFALRDLPMPQRDRLVEALRQCRTSAVDAEVRVVFGGYALRIYRGEVSLDEEVGVLPATWRAGWDGHEVVQLPGGLGWLRGRETIGEGIAIRHFSGRHAIVRGRAGGERLQPAGNRPRRLLKKLFQEAAVPPWERSRMPLVFFDEQLAWVPVIGVAAEFRAEGGERGIVPEWERG